MSNNRLWLPVVALLALHLAAFGAGFLTSWGYAEQDRARPLAAPDGLRLFGGAESGSHHLLGTDSLGRDVLSRLLYGARVSLLCGFTAALLAVALGWILGAVAGARGGLVDEVVMRGSELVQALPWFYLLLAVRAFLPLELSPLESFLVITVLIGLLGWPAAARQVRGAVLSRRHSDAVLAARATGLSELRLLARHLLPLTLPLAMIQLTLLIPRYIVAEVSLSFLGLGVAEPIPSWGSLLGELRQYPVLVSGWWLFSPALLLAVAVLSYHRLTEILQERLERGLSTGAFPSES